MATAEQLRKRELALIHMAKTQLAMDDDAYRAMLRQAAGVNSAKDLDWKGRAKVLEHLKACGFKPGTRPKRPLADDPRSRLIRHLWLDLHKRGRVRNPSEKALAAFVKRITGVEALQWLSAEQAGQVIGALREWAQHETRLA
jgi:phage gp16-like protein